MSSILYYGSCTWLYLLFFTMRPAPVDRNSSQIAFENQIDFRQKLLIKLFFQIQHFLNGGKCGVCGDVYGAPQQNQPPGKFALGIIVRRYAMNSVVTMWFEITASHRGYLEFRLCPNNDVTKPVTQECLDKYLLRDAHTKGTKFFFNHGTIGTFGAQVMLPVGLTCSQCVLQWRYRTGNLKGKKMINYLIMIAKDCINNCFFPLQT